MDELFQSIDGFDWDAGNLDKNQLAHGVEHWECEQVFFNRPLLIMGDLKHSADEPRWAAFGRTNADRLLTLVFTLRANLIRIISARDMNRKERKRYEASTEETT